MIGLVAFILVILSNFIGAFASLFLKKGAARVSLDPALIVKNIPLLAGISLYVLSAVTYVLSLRLADLTVIYPLTSLTYVIVAVISIRYLHEKITAGAWGGITFIILGVILIAR